MSKEQFLGQFRAILTALGTVLTTWGISDGNNWTPAIGVILVVASIVWGLVHHKDPQTAGQLSWSLVRKLVNVAGTAAVTYGLTSPEKVNGVAMLVATAGPFLAAWFSWIDNSESNDSNIDGLNILIALLAVTALLPGCSGLTLTAVTPYGDVSTTDGHTTVALRPIIIDEK